MSGVSTVDYGALDIADVTSDEINAQILRRLMSNEANNVALGQHNNHYRVDFEYIVEDARSMGVLGYYVGRSNIKTLFVQLPDDVDVDAVEQFFEGLQRNSSISELRLRDSHIPRGFFRMLTPFIKGNPNLVSFEVVRCEMDVEQFRSLSAALGEGKSLKEFCIDGLSDGGRYDHEQSIIHNIEVLKMHPQLGTLLLGRFAMERDVCAALADLMRQSASKYQILNLGDNDIDDAGVEALAGGNTLVALYLDSNPNITSKGWAAFSKALCDTTSVNNTFLSNHTLHILRGAGIPDDIPSLLALNHESDKKRVAFQKVLLHHDDFDMQPLFEWDLKMLPYIVGWLERAAAYGIETGDINQKRNVAAIYQFIRGMPELAIDGITGAKKKSGKVGGVKRPHSGT